MLQNNTEFLEIVELANEGKYEEIERRGWEVLQGTPRGLIEVEPTDKIWHDYFESINKIEKIEKNEFKLFFVLYIVLIILSAILIFIYFSLHLKYGNE